MSEPAAAHTTTAQVWLTVCRRDFDLKPRELGTLAAIAAYVKATGKPMPRAELERLAALHPDEISLAAPAVLSDEGLIHLVGSHALRHYDTTKRGLERLQR